MIVFAIEPLKDVWDDFVHLGKQHWEETEGYHRGQHCNPSFSRYNQYAAHGGFLMFTARDAGRMVGYLGVYIMYSMHSQEIIATEDAWYLLPEYRRGRNAVNFLRFAEVECAARGAIELTATIKRSKTNVGRLLEHLGYENVGLTYSKQLKESA